jgi:hypothetical protein
MPWTLDANGQPVFVGETPDRVAPAPAPSPEESAPPPPMHTHESAADVLSGIGSTVLGGALDTLLAPGNLLDAATGGRGDASGRQFLENVVALAGRSNEGAERYTEGQRRFAEEHPYLHGGAELVGQVLGGAPLGGLAEAGASALGLGRAGTAALTGAVEGATQNAASAREEAYIRNANLTGEQMLAAMGWGALVGGGTGLAVSEGGRLLFGRSGSRGATPFDSPRVHDVDSMPERAAPLPRTELDEASELGVENSRYLRSGMRDESLERVREEFASGNAPRPIELAKHPDGTIELQDGRHRMTVAKELGLTELPAKMRVYDDDLNVVKELEGPVSLAPRASGRGVRDALESAAEGGAPKPKRSFGEWFAEKLRGYSEERTAKAIGARGTDIRKLGRTAEAAEGEMRRMTRDVLDGELEDGTRIFRPFQSQEELVGNLVRAKNEAGKALGDFREKIASFIEDEAPALRPKTAEIADRIEQEVVAPLESSAVPQIQARARDVRGVLDGLRGLGDDVSLEQLQRVRQDLAEVVYPKSVGPGLPAQPPASAAELQRAERILEEEIEATTDRAATKMGGDAVGKYGELKAKFRSYREAAQIAGKAELQDLGNRVVSPSDYIFGAGAGMLHGGPAGVAAGVAGAVAHKALREHSSAVLAVLADRLAQRVDRQIGKGVDGNFTRALGQATIPRGQVANDVTRAALPRVSSRAASAIVTPLELFLGKHKDKQKAYQARAAEILGANENFGARIRGRVEDTLGDLPTKAPKLAASMVTTATRGAQFLATKLPAPTVNAQSFTPRSSALPVSDVQLHSFALSYAAVANPASTIQSFERGTLTPEQVEATKIVYPELYQTIVEKVQTKLRDLDAKGAFIPYTARLQLDLLLGLNGAGEPTASPAFVAMFRQIQAESEKAGGQEPGPTPPKRPINLASSLRSGRDAFDPGDTTP